MSYNNNNLEEIDTKVVKNQLIEMGLYEDGMGQKEMRDLLRTIKQSEQLALEEKEYRETLNKTNQNCAELLQLMNENKSPDTRYNLRSKDTSKEHIDCSDSGENSNDTFFPTHREKTTKENKPNLEITEETNSTITDVIEPVKSPKPFQNIDVFMPTEKPYQPLKLLKSQDVIQPFYCQPLIKSLPADLAAKAISKYHEHLFSEHKFMHGKSLNLVAWGEGKLCARSEVEIGKRTVEIQEENVIQSVATDTKADNYSLRSRRNIKRKLYTEVNSDEEEEISNKKSKDISFKTSNENDINVFDAKKEMDLSSRMDQIFDDLRDLEMKPQRKSSRLKDPQSSDEEPSTLLQVSAIIHNEGSPAKRKTRTPSHNKRTITKKNSDTSDTATASGDSIYYIDDNNMSTTKSTNKRKPDDIFKLESFESAMNTISDDSTPVRRRIVPPNPFRDKMSARSEQKLKNISKRRAKNPHSLVKPDSQKVKKEKEDDEDDEIFGISTNRFYGKSETKPKVASRLMVSPFEEKEYTCPICDKNFPVSIIEKHASGCTKAEVASTSTSTSTQERGSVCCHCDEFVLRNLEKHLETCGKAQLALEKNKVL